MASRPECTLCFADSVGHYPLSLHDGCAGHYPLPLHDGYAGHYPLSLHDGYAGHYPLPLHDGCAGHYPLSCMTAMRGMHQCKWYTPVLYLSITTCFSRHLRPPIRDLIPLLLLLPLPGCMCCALQRHTHHPGPGSDASAAAAAAAAAGLHMCCVLLMHTHHHSFNFPHRTQNAPRIPVRTGMRGAFCTAVHGSFQCGSSVDTITCACGSQVLRILQPALNKSALFHSMASASDDFDLFEALCSQPDLLELVVQQCSGKKNNLRLACSRLRVAVDACVKGLAWKSDTGRIMFSDPSAFFPDFNGAEGAKHMAVFARCPRLQTLDFNGRQVADFSYLATCIGLRRVTHSRTTGDNLTPFAALKNLEHLNCSHSAALTDISALTACTALKYLDCNWTTIKHLPPLPSLETLFCNNTPLTDISALVACTALQYLDCRRCGVTILPSLPASLEILHICGNKCADLSPLAACFRLRLLDCSNTLVQDLSPLRACAELRLLNCRDTLVKNLMPLLACKLLVVLECVDFDGVDNEARKLLEARPNLTISISEKDDVWDAWGA